MTVKLNANEVVIKAGDTNQIINDNKISGKLIVTNQRIYFKTLDEETAKFNLEILLDHHELILLKTNILYLVKMVR